MTDLPLSFIRAGVATAILLGGTLIGIASIDLVLPAVPGLPAAIGGNAASAQFVIAAFSGGFALGLLIAGDLGGRIEARRLLALSLAVFGGTSLLAATATTIDVLIPLRFLQGLFAVAPAVYAPSFIRRIFDEARAVRMLGAFGSIEALVPALAPMAGAWLAAEFGWRASFYLVALIALAVATLLLAVPGLLPQLAMMRPGGSYVALLRSRRYMRYALSQSLGLGSILVFVFGAPSVLTGPMGGTLNAFFAMQAIGVGFYIVGANLTGILVPRFGGERLIVVGTWLSAAGNMWLVLYALFGGYDPAFVPVPWILVNFGFGLKSPTGFYASLQAAEGNEARGSALVFFGFLGVSAIGTAGVAPFITSGLIPLSAGSLLFAIGSILVIVLLRPDK